MDKIKFNKILLKLAKLLQKYAPDGCITELNINKSVKDYVPNPRVSISYFNNDTGIKSVEKWECVASADDHYNDVDIDYNIFQPRKQPVQIDIKKSLIEQAK